MTNLTTPIDDISFSRPDFDEADVEAVLRVLRSGWLTTGSECAELERELGSYLGAGQVVAMSSCTAALETAVASLRLPAGARVAVPTWTFVSTALASAREGATPVLVDVDPVSLNLSAEALAAAIDDGIDAVVAVHFGGTPLVKEIHQLCADAGVPLVEDAAHALGADDHRGRVAGQGSVAACFSFYATKNLSCGEGGALVTDDGERADFARAYRLHGLSVDAWNRYQVGGPAGYELLEPGIKANLPDLLAGLARSQLRRFDGMQARRRTIVERYRSCLGVDSRLSFVPAQLDPGGADHLMVVVLPESADRSTVVASLTAEGIGSSVHFRPLHTYEWFRHNAIVGPAGTANADALAKRVLSLPLHPALTDEDVDRVCRSLRTALDS